MVSAAPVGIVASFTTEQAKITAEMRELDLLIESTQTEVNRLKSREDMAKTKLDEIRGNPSNFQREEGMAAGDEFASAQGRRLTMEGQMGSLQAKRKLLDRVQTLVASARDQLADFSAPPMPVGASPVIACAAAFHMTSRPDGPKTATPSRVDASSSRARVSSPSIPRRASGPAPKRGILRMQ